MNKYHKIWTGALFALGLVFWVGKMVLAQDPLEVAPNMYKLLSENDRVRIMEVTSKPNDTVAMHSHPDHVAVFITDGTLTLSYPDGSFKEASGKAGEAMWIPAESHAAKNTGTTEVKIVVIELKEPAQPHTMPQAETTP